MDYQTLRLSRAGHIARLELAQPDQANRIGQRMLFELAEVSRAVDDDLDLRVLVISGAGSDFCSGWASDVNSPEDVSVDPFGWLSSIRVPVVALLHGRVASAGLELALACDLRISSEDARFSCRDLFEGRVVLGGATARLPRIAGRSTTAAMLLLGEDLDASDAARCGLVSKVVDGDLLDREANAIATRIAANGPLGLRYAKEAVRRGLDMTLEQALQYELDLSIILQTTRDRAEGVDAFLKKRGPEFEGR